MLKKEFRLTKRKEFGYIYKNGKRKSNKELQILYTPTWLSHPRFGFVLNKKVGKAVTRNRIKRQLSEITRLNLDAFHPKLNYVIVVNPDIIALDYNQIQQSVLNLANTIAHKHKLEQNTDKK